MAHRLSSTKLLEADVPIPCTCWEHVNEELCIYATCSCNGKATAQVVQPPHRVHVAWAMACICIGTHRYSNSPLQLLL